MAISLTAAKELPSLEALKQRFQYDPETGIITETRVAGTYKPDKSGYGSIVIGFRSQLYKAHRLAWKIHYGSEPPAVIDHINGDPTDNRISNLRASCFVTNARNQKIRKDNKLDVRGVKYNKKNKNYNAQISVRGIRIHLGCFASVAEAAAVRRAAEITHFGEFSSLNRGAQS